MDMQFFGSKIGRVLTEREISLASGAMASKAVRVEETHVETEIIYPGGGGMCDAETDWMATFPPP